MYIVAFLLSLSMHVLDKECCIFVSFPALSKYEWLCVISVWEIYIVAAPECACITILNVNEMLNTVQAKAHKPPFLTLIEYMVRLAL